MKKYCRTSGISRRTESSAPYIAVTMGDPAGIGPEIVLKGITDKVCAVSRPVVIGDRSVLENALTFRGMPEKRINVISSPEDGIYSADTVNVIDLGLLTPREYSVGEVSPKCGRAAYEYIAYATKLALGRAVDAVATAPINKESLRAAGVPYIGHTEILGALTDSPFPITVFSLRDTLIFFLSRHISLKEACDITEEGVVSCAVKCFEVMERLGLSHPSMAVAGLNPHCGEHGLFGDEESRAIIPAVEKLRARGYDVIGPVGADSVFFRAFSGKYDSVLSLYHDQGHIATKTVDFYRTVSITGGLPFMRTSVDHGTAFDIAGKGVACGDGMEEALLVAAKYAPAYIPENNGGTL